MDIISNSLLLLTFFVGALACSDSEDPTPIETHRKYEIKSGIVRYNSDYLGFVATKIVYFDDYGAKERVETYEGEMLASCLFSDGHTRYNLNIEQKIAFVIDHEGEYGWEMDFPSWDEIQQFPDYDEDYTKLDNMTIAGKDCEAFRYQDIAVFAGWKGLTLYQQSEGVVIEAYEVEEDVTHDASLFKVPDGYTIQDLP